MKLIFFNPPNIKIFISIFNIKWHNNLQKNEKNFILNSGKELGTRFFEKIKKAKNLINKGFKPFLFPQTVKDEILSNY